MMSTCPAGRLGRLSVGGAGGPSPAAVSPLLRGWQSMTGQQSGPHLLQTQLFQSELGEYPLTLVHSGVIIRGVLILGVSLA